MLKEGINKTASTTAGTDGFLNLKEIEKDFNCGF